MEKELLELLESEINFHGECSSQMIEELLLFFKDREDTAIYIPSTGLYGYMRVKEYLSFFAQGLGRVQLTRYKGRFTLSVSQLSLDQ